MVKLYAVFLSLYVLSFGIQASPVTEDPKEIDRDFPPSIKELTLQSSGQQMVGHIYLAGGAGPHPTVIFLHGFPGNEKNLDLAQSLRRAGFNTLYFHYRGAWGSDGDFSIRGATEDAAAAIAYVKANAKPLRTNPEKISLFGHSLGGFNALHTGALDTSVSCTVAAAPAHLSKFAELSPEEAKNIALSGKRSVPGLTNYSMIDFFAEIKADLVFSDLRPTMAGFKNRPLLIISGDKDPVTTVESQLPLVNAAKENQAHPFNHIIMDADHSFSWRRIEFSKTVVNWMGQYCR